MDKETKLVWKGAAAATIGMAIVVILMVPVESVRTTMVYMFLYAVMGLSGYLYLTYN